MNEFCDAHSGFNERIKNTEDNVTELWTKYNNNQKLLIGSLITGIFSLVGVLTTLAIVLIRLAVI